MYGTEHWLVVFTFILVWDWLRMRTDMTCDWFGGAVEYSPSSYLMYPAANFFFPSVFFTAHHVCHLQNTNNL